MKPISRTMLREKPLDKDCLKAKISTHEYGFQDKRLFCYGIVDCFDDEYLQKCKECKAFVDNAEPLAELKGENNG